MGKKHRRGGGGANAPSSSDANSNKTNSHQPPPPQPGGRPSPSEFDVYPTTSLHSWMSNERSAPLWVLTCACIGFLLGLGIGTGHLTGAWDVRAAPWRVVLGARVRGSVLYGICTGKAFGMGRGGGHGKNGGGPRSGAAPTPTPGGVSGGNGGTGSNNAARPSPQQQAPASSGSSGSGSSAGTTATPGLASSSSSSSPAPWLSTFTTPPPPTPARQFATLREMIVRDSNGYVHPDLGFLTPAPCGAYRGVGMVRDAYAKCQERCVPGAQNEWVDDRTARIDLASNNGTYFDSQGRGIPSPEPAAVRGRRCLEQVNKVCAEPTVQRQHALHSPVYAQQELLLRIPYEVQMTRDGAVAELGPLIPAEVRNRSPLEELDDAPLLALLLAHERGKGRDSAFLAYIATLPTVPLCGYWPGHRSTAFDAVTSYGLDLGMDVNGWPGELVKASDYADRIADALARDYGQYIQTPHGMNPYGSITWALCQVVSRAIAGEDNLGPLRLVPLLDMVNHDASTAIIYELDGDESYDKGDMFEASADDEGAFVLTSVRYGRHKPLKKGQELLANYNVPGYSPFDWFVTMGFVPRERMERWEKLDAALPRSSSSAASRSAANTILHHNAGVEQQQQQNQQHPQQQQSGDG